jgi:cell division protein FtsL
MDNIHIIHTINKVNSIIDGVEEIKALLISKEEEIRSMHARVVELEEKVEQQEKELQEYKAEIIVLSRLKTKSSLSTSSPRLFGWF